MQNHNGTPKHIPKQKLKIFKEGIEKKIEGNKQNVVLKQNRKSLVRKDKRHRKVQHRFFSCSQKEWFFFKKLYKRIYSCLIK